jgi:O-antigen ligase/tetratricopeptide (TPR) repeat protein
MRAWGQAGAATGDSKAGAACKTAAMVLLLACVGARVFLSEMPYRGSLLNASLLAGKSAEALPGGPGREELSRVTFAILLPAIGALWVLGCALSGRLVVRHPWLAVMVAAFAAWSLVAALRASDKRSAFDVWIEQFSLMSACLLAVQLFGDRRRFVTFVAVLAGIGGLLAAKGLWQVDVEIPERIADFAANRELRLAEMGLAPGSAEAAVFEARLRSTTPSGFFVMSNLYASVLVITLLAAVGLAVDKLAFATATWPQGNRPRRKDQVHLPVISAILAIYIAAVCAKALVLSRSRGGIIAAGASLLAAVALVRWKRLLAAQWRKAAITVAAAFVLAAGAVVAYGLAMDRLPTKTMTFRWHYWTGGARIVAEHPWLGAGPGNFASAYLRHRRAAAEEAVKDPHNVVVHAATQYGLPGGALYLAVVGYALIAMARPRPEEESPLLPSAKPIPAAGAATVIMAMTAAALAARALVAGSTANAYYFVIDTAAPVAVFAAMLMAALWIGWREPRRTNAPTRPPPVPPDTGAGQFLKPEFSRIALACGVAGFMLHGMVEFGPWAPGAALVFWTAAGACLAQAGPIKDLDVSRLRWLKAATAGVFLAAAVVVFWRPVHARIMVTETASAELRAGDLPAATDLAEQAATTDTYDPWSAADAARTVLAGCQRLGPGTPAGLERACRWALEAHSRDPSYYGHAQLSANTHWMLAAPDAFAYSWRGMASQSAAFEQACRQAAEAGQTAAMSDLAWLLQSRGDYAHAAEWLRKAIEMDGKSYVLQAHLGEVLWQSGRPDEAAEAWRKSAELAPWNQGLSMSLDSMAHAAEVLNPMDTRLRLEYAKMLLAVGWTEKCARQLAEAEKIDQSLPPESLLRFSASERRGIEMLQAQSAAILRFQAPGKLRPHSHPKE